MPGKFLWSSVALSLLGLGLGCGSTPALTIHNGLDSSVRIEGLPGPSVEVQSSGFHRFDGLSSALELRAITEDFEERVSVALPPPEGEALWSIGGKSCFVEGDYSGYYSKPADVPPSISVIEILGVNENLYISDGKIDAAPQHRLPSTMKGGRVRALVQVPCDVAHSKDLARGWLEMTLEEIQPEGAKVHSPEP